MNIEEDEGLGWPSSWVDRYSCILVCVFLVTARFSYPDKTPHRDVFLPMVFLPVLEMRSARVRAGGGEEGTRAVPTHPTTARSQQNILSPARSYH